MTAAGGEVGEPLPDQGEESVAQKRSEGVEQEVVYICSPREDELCCLNKQGNSEAEECRFPELFHFPPQKRREKPQGEEDQDVSRDVQEEEGRVAGSPGNGQSLPEGGEGGPVDPAVPMKAGLQGGEELRQDRLGKKPQRPEPEKKEEKLLEEGGF